MDQGGWQWDAHIPPPPCFSGSLLVALAVVCIKKPPGVEPSPRAAVEETQSVLGAEMLKEEAAHAQVLSGEPGVAAAPGHHVWAELPG